nr:hypothetical protein [uncultured Ruminococcus sp.]
MHYYLNAEIERLINEKDVNTFYVGTQGNFDRMAYSVLAELRKRYQHIKVYRVLAYMPKLGDTDTIVPEGIETTYPRYAIIKRNKWMIDRSDYVIAYVTHPTGGAYQAVERVKKKGKILIQIR